MVSLTPEQDRLLVALPKAELHIHLEGSVRPSTFLHLARKAGLEIGYTDEAAVTKLFHFRGIDHFINLYQQCSRAFTRPEDFQVVTEELGADAAMQSTFYAEVTFTAETHHRCTGMPFDEMIDAIAIGAATARRDFGVDMRFIIDHIRGSSLDDCFQTAQWCADYRDHGVVALGLTGNEFDGPASSYSEAILWAKSKGVPFVPHVGEIAGPVDIWDALELGPSRIGHGIRSAEDPDLMKHLREHQIVLEICPTSNLRTKAVANLAAHPLRFLWDAKVPLTLNSDDPVMFNANLGDEYRLAATHFGFTMKELVEIGLIAVRAALVTPEERARLESRFKARLQHLGLD